MSEQPLDIDLGEAHLRPPRRETPPAGGNSPSPGSGSLPWEGRRGTGLAAAFLASWWFLVRSPRAAWAAVPGGGGVRRPWTFALLCGGIFGVVSELVDSATVAILRGARGQGLADLFQFDVAGRSLEWLPISMLSVAGCLFALIVGVPLFLLVYSLLVLAWTTAVHLLLKLTGGLASSATGYQGTLRAICYSQVAMAAAILPWVGDPVSGIWSFCLQVPGLVRMHGCSRWRAVMAVGLPAVLMILAAVLLAIFGDSEPITVAP